MWLLYLSVFWNQMNHLDIAVLITLTYDEQSVLGGLTARGTRMELHKLDSPSTAKLRPISEPPRSRCHPEMLRLWATPEENHRRLERSHWATWTSFSVQGPQTSLKFHTDCSFWLETTWPPAKCMTRINKKDVHTTSSACLLGAVAFT